MRWICLLIAMLLLAGPVPATAGAPRRVTLPNGLRLIVRPTPSTEVVAVELLLGISAFDEPREKNGLRYLTQRLLLRGTHRQSGDSIGRQLAAVGGVMDATVGLDYVELYALVPADAFEDALSLLADAVSSPLFPSEEMAIQKELAQEAARAATKDAFQLTYLAFREALYQEHPYAMLTLGAPRRIAALSPADMQAFHEQHYRPNNAVLSICGGVGEARATRAARRAFGDWAPGPPRDRPRAKTASPTASVVAARELPLRQAHLMLGFSAPSAAEADYYAVQVIDSILSGGSTSRLLHDLREDRGLVYQVSSFYPTLSDVSHFAIYAATAPHHVPAVKSAILQTLARLREDPVPPDELAGAKRYLLGSYAISHQRVKDQAYALAWYEMLGLAPDFEERYAAGVEAVTAADIQRAAKRMLNHFALAITMPNA